MAGSGDPNRPTNPTTQSDGSAMDVDVQDKADSYSFYTESEVRHVHVRDFDLDRFLWRLKNGQKRRDEGTDQEIEESFDFDLAGQRVILQARFRTVEDGEPPLVKMDLKNLTAVGTLYLSATLAFRNKDRMSIWDDLLKTTVDKGLEPGESVTLATFSVPDLQKLCWGEHGNLPLRLRVETFAFPVASSSTVEGEDSPRTTRRTSETQAAACTPHPSAPAAQMPPAARSPAGSSFFSQAIAESQDQSAIANVPSP